MTNRRNFVKQMAMAGIAANIPVLIFPRQESTQSIKLLVRADDIGNDYGRTKGIIRTFREGIVRSTSIMPSSQFFDETVQLCKANPALATGIHLTLLGTRTRPVLSPDIIPSIVTPQGFFYETLNQLNDANPDAGEMEKEIYAQVGKVRASGLNFVYLDWHRAVPKAIEEFIADICIEQQLIYGQLRDGSVCGYKYVTLMPETWPTIKAPDGQTIHYAAPALNMEEQQLFYDRLSDLKPGKWVTFLHPGSGEPQRKSVMELLCSQKTKESIKRKNIQLVSYYDIWKENFGKRFSQ